MTTIRAEGTDLVLPVRDGETILAALYRAGYAFRIGCRRGGCGVCKVELRDGSVDYPVTVSDQVLTPEEVSSGVTLACRAVPASDVVIAVPPEGRLRCIAPLLTQIACRPYHPPQGDRPPAVSRAASKGSSIPSAQSAARVRE